jgi:hypothetical protein
LRLAKGARIAANRAYGTQPPRYALLFPSNVTGTSTSSPYGVIEFANPQSSGFPPRGPSNGGWTVIRRVKPLQQTGYYAQFWYSRGDGSFQGTDFYVGFHPFPQNGLPSGTSHYWEIATEGGDMLGYDDNSNPQVVTKGQWYLQAFKLEYLAGTNQCRFWFWPNLPNVSPASGNIIRWTAAAGYGGTTPPSPKITIGNSPWMAGFQEERASCHHGQIKIIMADLTESEILSESSDMNTLVTTKAQNNIWWGKKGFTSVNDLTCDFGTGRSFVRNDSNNILTLGEAL